MTAQTAAEDAALAAAMTPTEENRSTLQAAQARLEGLRAELASLDMLSAAAARHEAVLTRAALADDLRAQERAALAAVDEVPSAFTAVQSAIRSLGVAVHEFNAKREDARQKVIACNMVGVDGLLLGAGVLVREAILAEGLGDAVDVSGVLQRAPEHFTASLERITSQSRYLVQTGIAVKIEALNPSPAEELAEPEPAGAPAHQIPGQPSVEYAVEHTHFPA